VWDDQGSTSKEKGGAHLIGGKFVLRVSRGADWYRESDNLTVELAILAATTGQLPRIARAVQIMRQKHLEESQASKWQKPPWLKRVQYRVTLH
jgi:hypothetical protein